MLRPPLCESLVAATSAPVEITLAQIFEEYEWDTDDILTALGTLANTLHAWGLEAEPALTSLGMDDSRVVRPKAMADPSELLELELQTGEGPRLEFKETLYLSVDALEIGGLKITECGSDKVLLSSLKTLAAFLNTDGGTLLIGVTDDGQKRSVAREYELTCGKGKHSFDQWELFFRRKVESLFVEGRSILPLIVVQQIVHDGGTVARVTVGARRKLTLIKWEKAELLFIRSGNETLSVRMSEIEGYFELRRTF